MTSHQPDIDHRLGMKLKFVYSLVGLLVGLFCIIVGMVLGLSGVVGHTSWTASVIGLSTSLTDAAPGVIVFIVGIFMVWITRFSVKHSREIERPARPRQEDSRGHDDDPKVGGGGGGGGSLREHVAYSPQD